MLNSKQESLLKTLVKRSLIDNNITYMNMAIDKGLDLDKHKIELLEWCRNTANYNSIHFLDNDYYDSLLKNIQILDISNQNIKTLKNISCLKNLKTLNCENNKLTSLEGIEGLPNIGMIKAGNNPLKTLRHINNLEKLNYIKVSWEHIEDFDKSIIIQYIDAFNNNTNDLINRNVSISFDALETVFMSDLINLIKEQYV